MVNKIIIDILKDCKVPVSFQKYSGKAREYITFHEYFCSGEEFEDDEEYLIGHYIQIDIWSICDYTKLVNMVKKILVSNGFKRINEIDLYEEESKTYHKGIKFYYLEIKEEI